MADRKLLVLIGSGPGIGLSTAKLFASNGYNVALLSRNAERLNAEKAAVKQAGSDSIDVEAFPVDVSDHEAFEQALDNVKSKMGNPHVVVYNAARVGASEFGKFTPDELLSDFKLNGVGIYVVATWAVPRLAETAKSGSPAAFLLSGSGINYQPLAPFFSLSMQKAAQSNFLKSLDQIAGPQGVHVARLDINGMVSPEDDILSPDKIAKEHWRLSQQPQAEWEHVVQIGSNMKDFAAGLGIKYQDW